MKHLPLLLTLFGTSAFAGTASSPLFNYTVFAKEKMVASCSDVQGRTAAGGKIFLQDYMIRMGANETGCALESGEEIYFKRGKILAGENISCTGSKAFYGWDVEKGADRPSTAPFDYLNSELDRLSASLAAPSTDARIHQITLTLENTQTQKDIHLSGSADQLLVVNVLQSDVEMYGYGITLSGGLSEQNIIWNFPNATKVFIAYSGNSSLGIPGTLLAPNADVTFNNALITGALFAKSITAKSDNPTSCASGVVGGQINGSCLNGNIGGIGCGVPGPARPRPQPPQQQQQQNPWPQQQQQSAWPGHGKH